MTLFRMENVAYTYSKSTPFEKQALKNISFFFDENEFIGIVGQTGSGKSTLTKFFNGLLKPDSGSVFFQEDNIWKKNYDLRALRFAVGVAFQYPEHQIFSDTVKEDIAFGLVNQGIPADEQPALIKEALETVGLGTEYLEQSPFKLSGGEVRRVSIANIIVMQPKLFILDEPTAGLDPAGRKLIYQALKNYQKKTHSTIAVISHSMDDVAEYADRILVLDRGTLLKQGTPHEIFQNPADLQKIGLDLPELTTIFSRLHDAGVSVPANVYTLKEAKQELVKLLAGDRYE